MERKIRSRERKLWIEPRFVLALTSRVGASLGSESQGSTGMGSKRFKGKTCTYCGTPHTSATNDHVFAQAFFVEGRRQGLPQVPACARCNVAKSKLEHYLAQVLPLGGRHVDAETQLLEHLPRRFAKDRKTHGALRDSIAPTWVRTEAGLILKTSTVRIDAANLDEWCRYIARGLAFYHWGVVLGPDARIDVGALTDRGMRLFDEGMARRGAGRIQVSLGDGTFAYEGLQGADNPEIALWRLAIYGGATFGGVDEGPRSSCIGMIVGPDRIYASAMRRAKWTGKGKLILPP